MKRKYILIKMKDPIYFNSRDTFVLSLPEGIRASRFSTTDSLVKPFPSAGISSEPLRAISPKAVHAATASSAVLLSRKVPE